jgi:hypothetical protein
MEKIGWASVIRFFLDRLIERRASGTTYSIEMRDDSISDIFTNEVVLRSLCLSALNHVLSSPSMHAGKGMRERGGGARARTKHRRVAVGEAGKLVAAAVARGHACKERRW